MSEARAVALAFQRAAAIALVSEARRGTLSEAQADRLYRRISAEADAFLARVRDNPTGLRG
ncbi:hypothetical protein EJV44_15380 [Ancylobacter aquaticus]|nr:hypothetical protein EJV44_15380 [Ancylobacter aquaticus]